MSANIQPHNIPSYLRQFNTWAISRTDKTPITLSSVINCTDIGFKINNLAEHGGRFEDAIRILATHDPVQRHSAGRPPLFGPSVGLIEEMETVVIDLDDPVKVINERRQKTGIYEGQVLGRDGKPLSEEQVAAWIKAAIETQAMIRKAFAGHWQEVSMSGSGSHIVIRGKLIKGTRYQISDHGSIFASRQTIHMTGDLVEGSATEIFDGQAILEEVIAYFSHPNQGVISAQFQADYVTPEDRIAYMAKDETFGRRLDLTDAQVVDEMSRRYPKTYVQFIATGGWSNHSLVKRDAIGDLDKITGDPDQVNRIMLDSNLMLHAGPDKDGHSRYDKYLRTFDNEMVKARRSNNTKLAAWVLDAERKALMAENFKRITSDAVDNSILGKARIAAPVMVAEVDGEVITVTLTKDASVEDVIANQPPEDQTWVRLFLTKDVLDHCYKVSDKKENDYVRIIIDTVNAERKRRGPVSAPVAVSLSEKQGRFSPLVIQAIEELTAHPLLEVVRDKFLTETTPPGLMGDLVRHVYLAMYEPFLKFATPAVLSGISAIVGRGNKLPDGNGLNLFMLMFAKTAIGKTESAEAMMNAIEGIRRGINNAPGEHRMTGIPDYFQQVMIDSRQGGHQEFQETPSMCWTVDECANLLDMVINPQVGSSSSAISDMLNKLFEMSRVGKKFRRPGSRTAQKQGEYDIENLTVACYWATTTSNATKIVGKPFIESGLGGRCIPTYHKFAGGESHNDLSSRVVYLPQGPVRDRLKVLIAESMELQALYASANAALVPKDADAETTKKYVELADQARNNIEFKINHVQYTPGAWALSERFRKASDNLKYPIHNEESPYPDTYLMFSRSAMNVGRIAAIIAVFNATGTVPGTSGPVIIDEQTFCWAAGYVLQRVGEFLTAFDRNEYGATMNEAETTVVQAVRDLLARDGKYRSENRKWVELGAVPYGALSRLCRSRAPFKRDDKTARAEMIRCLEDMVKGGSIAKGTPQGQSGDWYFPSAHRLWDEVLERPKGAY